MLDQSPFFIIALEKCHILEGGEYIFNTTSRYIGTVRSVECVENYFRVGDPVIRCNPDKNWSSHPICESKYSLLNLMKVSTPW